MCLHPPRSLIRLLLMMLPNQEFTNYHFDCKPDALRGGLERFAQFFIAPLCKADALEREVNAVDNEFSGA
jgi:nardilysin